MNIRTLLAIVMFVAGATQLSCNVNEYCLNCARGDGGHDGSGSGSDGGSTDADDSGTCVPTGVEVCDGKDNDCNGLTDDGTVLEVGDLCANQVGECSGGVKQCVNGALTCTRSPVPETCDTKDNDCNGLTDEGDPGGGAKCGTDVGECVAGVMHCMSGTVQCIGAIGGTMAPFGTAETCDGKDNDCDGSFDEGLTNLGACGPKTCITSANAGALCTTNAQCPGGTCAANVGLCLQGTLSCQGGGLVCGAPPMGAPRGPTFETCDNLDNDCDGVVDDGYNLASDPQNCGMCGTVCGMGIPNGGHANWGCGAGTCIVAGCKAGYHDLNGLASDGCEFGVCFSSGPEVCDGVDNDCDNMTDEGIGAAPAICATAGECAGTVATCDGTNGWRCHYGATVSTDPMSMGTVIVAETKCDTKDNDCDARIDEGQPNLNQACHDNGIGECQGKGTFVCDAANLNGPAVCNITMPGATATAEICDNKDNNCNGMIDDGGGSGSLVGQEWISIGNSKQMMKYEASKPDADMTTSGSVQTIACSKSGVLPWTNLTYPQAVAACTSVGARLCTEQEWHRTCSVVAPSTYPIALAMAGTVTQLVEAEDYFANVIATDTSVTPNVTHAWVADLTAGYSGISAMQANPDSGSNLTNANVLAMGPHLDFRFNFQKATSTYHIWVLMNSPNGNANRVVTTVDGGAIANANQVTTSANNAWQWRQGTATPTITAGLHTISVYMVRDGVKVDAIVITDANTTPGLPTNSKGGHWSYATNPSTYQATTCNGQDLDPAQDTTRPTGSLASCFANGTTTDDAYDMSGNVKEWTLAHQPGENPIRGGAANNTAEGISCSLNFTLADNAFFFPNVGFRCCR